MSATDTNLEHTPGPWMAASAISSVVGLPVVALSGQSIASVHVLLKQPEAELEDAWRDYRAECMANARLIAAAPEMLAALLAVHESAVVFGRGEHAVSPEAMLLVDAALAKAYGRPPAPF